jgi:adenine-specific DNA-methyltransferase
MSVFIRQSATMQKDLKADGGWVILSPIEASIKTKIEVAGTPLKDWDINIYRGILTGYNEAFIINQKTRDKLIEASSKNAEIIRPILRGRDIKKYSVEFANSWLLYIPWHFPLNADASISGVSTEAEEAFVKSYPDIYCHLSQHKENLLKRNQAETGIRYEWYALQRSGITYFNDFIQEKIVWLTISDKAKFAIDNTGAICLDTAFFLTGENIYTVLSVLNSKLIEWYFDKICPSTGAGTNQWKKFIVETIPVPKVVNSTELDFKAVIENIVEQKKAGNITEALETQLNEMVLNLYKIDQKEIESLF